MVYLPREDSLLLLECAKEGARALGLGKGARVLEIGVGSGFVAGELKRAFPQLEVWGTDVDREAVEEAKKAYPSLRVVEGDLFAHLRGPFHLILFNPPYLEREEGESYDRAIHEDGSIERFLWQVGSYMAEGGAFIIILSDAHSRFRAFVELMEGLYSCELCRERGVGFEKLYAFLCKHPFEGEAKEGGEG